MADDNSFKSRFASILGLDDDYLEDEDEEYIPESEAAAGAAIQTEQTVANVRSVQPESSPDVLVLDPTTFDEAPGIVNKLKQDKTVVVNLKQTDFEEGRKIFDFLSGAVFALEGSLNRVAESVFILAPKIISVATQMDTDTTVEESESIITYQNED